MQEQYSIQLKPVIEPTPAAFSMDTIGWKFLLFVLLFGILYAIYKFFIHYKSNQYRREAIAKIQSINANSEITIPNLITLVMIQIKQTALRTFGRKKVASMEGEQWLQFLDNSAKSSNFNQYQDVILKAIYKNEFLDNSDFKKGDFVNLSLKWIKEHAR